MVPTLITLTIVGIVLIAISLFMSDKIDLLESQYEELSISMMQDTYQMKIHIMVLEEVLLTDGIQRKTSEEIMQQQILIQKVYELNEEGLSEEDITVETGLDYHAVKAIINNK